MKTETGKTIAPGVEATDTAGVQRPGGHAADEGHAGEGGLEMGVADKDTLGPMKAMETRP